MWLIPFDRSQLLTSLTKEQFAERLRQSVSVGRTWAGMFGGSVGQIVGKTDGDRFVLMRKCGYQNSYLPIVRGKLRSDGSNNGLVVDLTFIAPFFFPAIGLILLGEGFLLENGRLEAAILWAGFGVVVHVVCWLAYRGETRIIERTLNEIALTG